jgi:branched-chain amino acid transport system substrate-binding protein
MEKNKLFCRYKLVSVCFLVFLLVLLYGNFSAYSEEVRGVTGDTIKMAIVCDMTGPAAHAWSQLMDGVRTYIRYVNDRGGVNGKRIKLIIEDTRISIPGALAAFKKIVYKDKVLAYWGPASSSELHALFPQIEKQRMPTVSPSPTPKALTPFKRYVFIVCTLYHEQAKVMLDYVLNDLKAENPKIAVVYPDNESGKNLLDAIRRYTKYYKLDLLSEQVMNFGAIDASSQVLNLKRAGADYVFHLGLIGGTVALLKEARKFGYKPNFFDTMYGCDDDVLKAVGDAARNFHAVSQFSAWHEESKGMAELREVRLKYHPDSASRTRSYTQSWVVGMIFVEAMKRAGRNLNGETFVDALESMENFDTNGLSGFISFSPKNHKAVAFDRIYKADIERKVMAPITDWRKPLPMR